MAKAKKTTPKKPRADKYYEKFAIKGRFADVFKVIKRVKWIRKACPSDLDNDPELDEREWVGRDNYYHIRLHLK